MRGTPVVIGLVVCAALAAGCSASSPSPTTPAGIVSVRCTKCHNTDRIKAASHDAVAWAATVDRMRGKGAQLSGAEAQQVVEFLAGGGAAGL